MRAQSGGATRGQCLSCREGQSGRGIGPFTQALPVEVPHQVRGRSIVDLPQAHYDIARTGHAECARESEHAFVRMHGPEAGIAGGQRHEHENQQQGGIFVTHGIFPPLVTACGL